MNFEKFLRTPLLTTSVGSVTLSEYISTIVDIYSVVQEKTFNQLSARVSNWCFFEAGGTVLFAPQPGVK